MMIPHAVLDIASNGPADTSQTDIGTQSGHIGPKHVPHPRPHQTSEGASDPLEWTPVLSQNGHCIAPKLTDNKTLLLLSAQKFNRK